MTDRGTPIRLTVDSINLIVGIDRDLVLSAKGRDRGVRLALREWEPRIRGGRGHET